MLRTFCFYFYLFLRSLRFIEASRCSQQFLSYCSTVYKNFLRSQLYYIVNRFNVFFFDLLYNFFYFLLNIKKKKEKKKNNHTIISKDDQCQHQHASNPFNSTNGGWRINNRDHFLRKFLSHEHDEFLLDRTKGTQRSRKTSQLEKKKMKKLSDYRIRLRGKLNQSSLSSIISSIKKTVRLVFTNNNQYVRNTYGHDYMYTFRRKFMRTFE